MSPLYAACQRRAVNRAFYVSLALMSLGVLMSACSRQDHNAYQGYVEGEFVYGIVAIGTSRGVAGDTRSDDQVRRAALHTRINRRKRRTSASATTTRCSAGDDIRPASDRPIDVDRAQLAEALRMRARRRCNRS